MNKTPLREKKKAESRQAIVDAAIQLFSTKGYDNTTLLNIAEAANISQRTIFTYFPSKESIIFDSDQKSIDDLVHHLNNRGTMSVFDWLRYYHGNMPAIQKNEKKQSLIDSTPALREHSAKMLSSLENTFGEMIAVEQGLQTDSVQVKIIAAIFRTLAAKAIVDSKVELADSETALKFIEAGLKATS